MPQLTEFYVKQRLALTVNRFDVVTVGPDGLPGQTVCVAEQKRMALRERITFFADEGRTQPVFSMAARSIMEVAGTYDVLDGQGMPLATFRKDFGASLLRTTYHVEGPGYVGSGQERSMLVALLRRFSDLPFLPIHFDYVASDGAPLFVINREPTARDRYLVRIMDPRVDFRVAAAMTVAMDVLLER